MKEEEGRCRKCSKTSCRDRRIWSFLEHVWGQTMCERSEGETKENLKHPFTGELQTDDQKTVFRLWYFLLVKVEFGVINQILNKLNKRAELNKPTFSL